MASNSNQAKSKRLTTRTGKAAVKELTSTLSKKKSKDFRELIKFLKKNDVLFAFRTHIGAIDIKPPGSDNWRRYYVYKEKLEDAGKVSPSKLKKSIKKKLREPKGRLSSMSDDEKKPLSEWKNTERFKNTMDRLGVMDYHDADEDIFRTLSEEDEKVQEEEEQVEEELAAGFGGQGTRMEEEEEGEASEEEHSEEDSPKTATEMRMDESKREEFSEMIYDSMREDENTLSERAEKIYRNLQDTDSGTLTVGRSQETKEALEELKKEGLAFFDEYADDPNRYAVVTSDDDGMRMQELFHPLQESNDKHYYDYETKGGDKGREQAGNSKDERLPEGWEEVKSTYGKLSESHDEVTLEMIEEEMGREMTAKEYKQLQEFWHASDPTSDAQPPEKTKQPSPDERPPQKNETKHPEEDKEEVDFSDEESEMEYDEEGEKEEAKVNFSDVEERQVRGDVNPDQTRARQHNKRTRSGKPVQEAVRSAIEEALTDKTGNNVDVEPETERKDMRGWLKEQILQLREDDGSDVEEIVENIMQRLDERRFREDIEPDGQRTRRHNKRRRLFLEIKEVLKEALAGKKN